MVKGGFQGLDITGVDLTAQSPTLPGSYATCAGADGKPIRVQTADGQVECSVKKVSTNYVLAGITGDGKILSITISSTDGISVSEAAIPSGEEPEVYLDGAIDISTATTSDPYTTEYDGIVRLRRELSTTISNTPMIMIKTGAAQTSNNPLMSMSVETPATHVLSCFVKKGTKIYATGIVENVISAKFLPYKQVQS